MNLCLSSVPPGCNITFIIASPFGGTVLAFGLTQYLKGQIRSSQVNTTNLSHESREKLPQNFENTWVAPQSPVQIQSMKVKCQDHHQGQSSMSNFEVKQQGFGINI